MRHKKVSFSELNDDRISFYMFEDGNTNSDKITEMKLFMNLAIKNELTPLQHYCLMQSYSGRKKKDIARELGLHPSTVTRHVQRALNNLKKVSKYYNKS